MIPYLGRAQGGPVFGLASYTRALAGSSYEVAVLSSPHPRDGQPVGFDSRVKVITFGNPGWSGFRRCPKLGRALSELRCDIIHSHGLWTDAHRAAAVQARRRRLPHLLAPCGMLMPGALHHHWWKKIPVRFWFQDRALREAQCLHAKSEREYESIRGYGLRNPTVIIPNPIFEPSRKETQMHEAEFCRTFGIPGDKNVVLFLGRLHRVKGLARLIRAWSAVESQHRQWVLVLAGPDEGGYRSEIESLITQLGCRDSVVFTGELDDLQKWGALAAADVFVMPSDFENFGNSIVEAMLSGTPVITTTGTPWKELHTTRAGWWVPPTSADIAHALRDAMAMCEDERVDMGRRAAGLAGRFSSERCGKELIRVYEWLLGKELKPECVITN